MRGISRLALWCRHPACTYSEQEIPVHYLVDTYNLVHAAAAMGGPLGDLTVRKLCQYIATATTKMKVTLVLDGRAKPDEPSANEFPGITLEYSGAGVKADLVIEQLVERAQSRKKLTVVSNDRAVVLHARRNYAGAMSCEAFLKELTQYNPRASAAALPAKKVTGTETKGESEHWMKEFGLEMPAEEKKKSGPAPTGVPEIDALDIEKLLGPREGEG
jgi:predicted RNA-binding protein with PIN domain